MSQSGVLVSASPSKPKSTRYDDATAIIAPPRPSWMKGTAESNWTANSNKKQELKLDSKLVAAVKVEEHSNMMDEEAPFDAFRVASTHATPSLGESPSTAGPSRRSQATEIEDPAQAQRKRDEEALTIIEKLELGPKEFRGGNCEWKTVEPNSGIRLRSRSLEHTQVQANMEARYYLSPSVIYSIIRLGRNRQHFDVPVEGDWVTIAVVCGVKNSRTKDKKEREEDEDVDASEDEAKKQAKEKRAQQDNGPRGKVFYNGAQMSNKPMENHGRAKAFANVRLCALPPRKNGELVTAGGDAMLNMLLFSADGETKDHRTGAVKYRGGSGGAYEKYWKLSVGTVIGVVSPKVLRPYGVSTETLREGYSADDVSRRAKINRIQPTVRSASHLIRKRTSLSSVKRKILRFARPKRRTVNNVRVGLIREFPSATSPCPVLTHPIVAWGKSANSTCREPPSDHEAAVVNSPAVPVRCDRDQSSKKRSDSITHDQISV